MRKTNTDLFHPDQNKAILALARRIRAGGKDGEKAFEVLAAAACKRLGRFFASLDSLADDARQEALLRLWRAIIEWRLPVDGALLLKHARRRVIDAVVRPELREQAKRKALAIVSAVPTERVTGFDEARRVEDKVDAEKLSRIFKALDPGDRKLLQLRYGEELSQDAIAGQMDREAGLMTHQDVGRREKHILDDLAQSLGEKAPGSISRKNT